MVATPSRIISNPPLLMKSNRLLRRFASEETFVYVQFRDEDSQALYSEDVFNKRFHFMLDECGIRVQGLRLQFLVCSSSQTREQTAVFLIGEAAGVARIREIIIPDGLKFLKENKTPKYMSRLGLFCTADAPTAEIPMNESGDIKVGEPSNGVIILLVSKMLINSE